jgi:hypothetical protein
VREKKYIKPGEKRKKQKIWFPVGGLVSLSGNKFGRVTQTENVPGLERILVVLATGKEVSIKRSGCTLLVDSDLPSGHPALALPLYPTEDQNGVGGSAATAPSDSSLSQPRRVGRSDDPKKGGSRREKEEGGKQVRRGGTREEREAKGSSDRYESGNRQERAEKSEKRSSERRHRSAEKSGHRSESKGKKRQHRELERSDAKSASSGGKKQRVEDKAPSWLHPQLRVRVVSEKLGGGVAYLKKGVVQEVTGHKQCRILLDSGGVLLAKVRQSSLETALPKVGGRVLAVAGSKRGCAGLLLERSSKSGTARVQLDDEPDPATFSLDDVCEVVP